MRGRPLFLIALASALFAAIVVACTLNPQPLPPVEASNRPETSSDAAFGTPPPAEGSTQDAGPTADAGQGTATDASDAEADASSDAETDAAADASSDADAN